MTIPTDPQEIQRQAAEIRKRLQAEKKIAKDLDLIKYDLRFNHQRKKHQTRKKLYFTTKQWKKLDVDKQEILTKRFEVILTDHHTRLEKAQGIISKIDITEPKGRNNLRTAIEKIHNGVEAFSKATQSISGDKIFPSQQEHDAILGFPEDKKDYKKIVWGSSNTPHKKQKEQDVKKLFWG